MSAVIVVEDEDDYRASLREVFAYEGFATIDVGSADSAAPLLREAEVGLLVTDIDLPGNLDGIALAKVARQQHPEIPIIFISGQPPKLAEAWVFNGPAAFFHKPFSFKMLVAAARGFVSD